MPISVSCPDCFQEYSVKDELAGKKIRCKGCQGIIKVEAANGELDDIEDADGGEDEPASRKSRTSPARADKSKNKTKPAKGKSSGGGWSEVPWMSAGIPLGTAVVLFLLSQVLPHGAPKMLTHLLATLTLLGCGLAGLYMLARVSSHLGRDLDIKHMRTARKLGGGDAAIAFASIGIIYVMIRGMIQAPRQTSPWFMMMVTGIVGMIWLVKNGDETFKPQPQQNSSFENWNQPDLHPSRYDPPRKQ